MTERVIIESAPDDLAETLSERGLEARRVEDDVEVTAEGEEGVWNLELVSALEAWLEDERRDELTARHAGTVYTVRSPEARALEPSRPAAAPLGGRVGIGLAALALLLLVLGVIAGSGLL